MRFRVSYIGLGLSLLAAAAVLPFAAGYRPLVRFPRERIDVHVHADRVVVEGIYHYVNPWPFPVIQEFYYPMPEGEGLVRPERIEVIQTLPVNRSLPVRHSIGEFRYQGFFPGHGEIAIEVRYEQPAPFKHCRYVLTTTAPWRRSLDEGQYRLHAHGVVIRSSNFPLSVLPDGLVGFDRRDFMPTREWEFSWEVNR